MIFSVPFGVIDSVFVAVTPPALSTTHSVCPAVTPATAGNVHALVALNVALVATTRSVANIAYVLSPFVVISSISNPDDPLAAFAVVCPVPPFPIAIVVPFHVPDVIVPTDVNDDVTTVEFNTVPVSVPAGAAANVANVPNDVPFVFVHVIAPAAVKAQSPDNATAVAAFDPLPTQMFADVNDGSVPAPDAAHVGTPLASVNTYPFDPAANLDSTAVVDAYSMSPTANAVCPVPP